MIDPSDFVAQRSSTSACQSLESQEVAKDFPRYDPTAKAGMLSLHLESLVHRHNQIALHRHNRFVLK